MPASGLGDFLYFNLEGKVCTGRKQSNHKYNRNLQKFWLECSEKLQGGGEPSLMGGEELAR